MGLECNRNIPVVNLEVESFLRSASVFHQWSVGAVSVVVN